ncbi:MAG TPA: response regulator transcription factor [Steroidobacteraceae bacterium]|nr:response regulator transcription factor [Steroidobacteraceae bacterium]
MRILLVEDHQDIAENISDYFDAHGDHVEHVSNGVTGLQLARSQQYDVIVLDLMLPGMDGISLCRKLREEAHVHTPVLMLTAKDMLSDKAAGFEAGADDYLVKPFSLLELGLRLRALARRPSTIAPADTATSHQITVADLKFDLDTLTAERAQRTIKLNPTTRRLLAILMQNAHRVVTREELEQSLWGNEVPEGDVLRAHMHALRAAIDKGFATKLLHTIHGIGYRLYVAGDHEKSS